MYSAVSVNGQRLYDLGPAGCGSGARKTARHHFPAGTDGFRRAVAKRAARCLLLKGNVYPHTLRRHRRSARYIRRHDGTAAHARVRLYAARRRNAGRSEVACGAAACSRSTFFRSSRCSLTSRRSASRQRRQSAFQTAARSTWSALRCAAQNPRRVPGTAFYSPEGTFLALGEVRDGELAHSPPFRPKPVCREFQRHDLNFARTLNSRLDFAREVISTSF